MHPIKKILVIAAAAASMGATMQYFSDFCANRKEPDPTDNATEAVAVSPDNDIVPEAGQKEPATNSKGTGQAEDTSVSKSESLNYDDELALSNKITDNIARHRSYMKDVYDQLSQIKVNPKSFVRLITEDIRRLDDHAHTDAPSASTREQALRDNYNALCNLDNSLNVYIKLEDYKTDRAARGMKILDDMSALVAELAAERNRLRETARASRKHVIQNEHGKAYGIMMDIIDHEEKVLAHLDAVFQDNPPKGLDEDFLIRSYLETGDLLRTFEKEYDLHYPDPANRFAEAFPESIRRLQQVKQRAVDENGFADKKSSNHANGLIEEYAAYFNNEVLAIFGYFVKTVRTKEASMRLYPKYLPLLRHKDYRLDVPIEPRSFNARQVPILEVKPRKAALNRAAFDVLNGYVEALNVRTNSLDHFRPILKNFERDLNYVKKTDEKSRQQYKLRFHGDSFRVPKIDYADLRKRSPELIPEYSAQLLGQLENIQEILLKCESLRDELAIYSENRVYLSAGFAGADEMLERFSVLFDTYRSMKERLFKDVRAVYDAYPGSRPDNPWKVTSVIMRRAVDEAKSTLQAVKTRFSGDKSQAPAADTLLSICRDMVVNQAKYMAGIQRMGQYHGHCPYKPYENMAEELKSMIEKIGRIDSYVENGRHEKYDDYVYVYNRIAENYNKFAELAKGDVDSAKDDVQRPVYILFQTTAF